MVYSKIMKRKVLIISVILSAFSLFAGCGKTDSADSKDSSFDDAKAMMQEMNEEGKKSENNASSDTSKDSNENAFSIDGLIYKDEHDREYLTPTTDDFEIIIYDIPTVYIIPKYTVYKDSYGIPMGYGLSRGGEEYTASCKYIKVISYDVESKVSLKEKLAFDSENDALRPALASYMENWIDFPDGNIPADFDEEEAILKICDENVVSYVGAQDSGEKIKRFGNIWYGSKDDKSTGGYSLSDIYMISLRDDTKEFKAKNTDDNGLITFTMRYESYDSNECNVTVYYSKPFNHGKTNEEQITLESISKRLNNPDDATVFAPETDDYLYYIDGGEINLMSFDENGDIVQWVTRYDDSPDGYGNVIYDDDYLPYFTLSKDKRIKYDHTYKIAKDNNCLITKSSYGHTIKFDYIYNFYFDMGISDNATLVLSKGLTRNDTLMKSDDDPMIEKIKKIVPEGKNDYIITIDKDKYSTEGIKGYYNDIAYYRAFIEIFDETGYNIDSISVQIFDDPSMIDDENKRTFGTELDENGNIAVNHEFYDRWADEFKPQTYENLYYYHSEITDDRYKWQEGRLDEDTYWYYFSIPYLTDEQLENMDEYYR
ncbi:MAG: hypothetical protein J5525_01665 [Lachnospiraceae bacterium]|nr:hypothetical protein [Lachnospiraceae bacterium]